MTVDSLEKNVVNILQGIISRMQAVLILDNQLITEEILEWVLQVNQGCFKIKRVLPREKKVHVLKFPIIAVLLYQISNMIKE